MNVIWQRNMRSVVLLLILCTSIPECCAQTKSAKSKLTFDDIRGTWTAKTVTADGAPISSELATQLQWTFKDNQTLVIQQLKDGPTEQCVFRFNPDSIPVSFQFDPPADKIKKPPTGSDLTNINPVVIGILKIKAQHLIVNLCRRTRTPSRPESFKSTPGSDTILIKFSRPPENPERGHISK